VVSSTTRPHFTPGKDPVHILQEAGWAPGPVWTGGKSRLHRDLTVPTELPGPLILGLVLRNVINNIKWDNSPKRKFGTTDFQNVREVHFAN